MSSTSLFVDVEEPVRDWLRSASVPVIEERFYIGLPAGATFPACEMALMDGGVQPGEAPLANALFTFSVWGADASAASRASAKAGAWALASLFLSTNHASLSDGLTLMGVSIVTGPTPRYDADGTPRYQLDAALALVKAA
jgi:hypothetical protein